MLKALAIIAIIPSLLLWGWVLQKNWAWFIEPQFGLETPSVAMCLGISTLIRGLTYQYSPETPYVGTENERMTQAVGTAFMLPLLWLLMGWIISAFV